MPIPLSTLLERIPPSPARTMVSPKTLTFLTAKRENDDPQHWVVLYGPHIDMFNQSAEETYTFIDVSRATVKGKGSYDCVVNTGTMPSHFRVAAWASKRDVDVPREKEQILDLELDDIVKGAVQRDGGNWAEEVLDELLRREVIGSEKRAELLGEVFVHL